jgi:urease accessory protein
VRRIAMGPVGRRRWAATLAVLGWAVIASPVAAHENQVIRLGSFWGGAMHPALGLDHLLAMVSVGILSVQIGGRAIFTVPATFVCVMAVGGLVGFSTAAIPLPLVELGISLSVLFLGAALALETRLPVLVAMAFVGIFATFHGYAHGVEIPQIAQPAEYAAGFLLGTAVIHVFGVLIGEVARQYQGGPRVLRAAGAAISVSGALFLVGVL